MLLSRKELNQWPAFSDMMFMLALTMLVAGAVAFALLGKEREELEKLGVMFEGDKPVGCGLAEPVLKPIEACLDAKQLRNQRHGCSLSVEDSIEFEFNEATLLPDARARASGIAECIIEGARALVDVEKREKRNLSYGLDAISIEGHADRCGYRSWSNVRREGISLPADRAKAVYDLVFERLQAKYAGISASERASILSRIATRSFGPYRPRADSKCDCTHPDDECRRDRRVEIVVQGRVDTGEPNWAPVPEIMFRKPIRRAAENAEDVLKAIPDARDAN